MKIDGIHGDFIVYEKHADEDCPIRISFMKQDKELSKLKAQKVKLRKTEIENKGGSGYALDSSSYMKWFDTMPLLIDFYKNDPIHPFKRPYFHAGRSDVESSPVESLSGASSVDNVDVDEQEFDIKGKTENDPSHSEYQDLVCGLKNIDIKEKNVGVIKKDTSKEHEMPRPAIRKKSTTSSVERHIPPSSVQSELDDNVIYDHPDAKSLLAGFPAGTYVIHHDHKRHTETNPYTLYAVKASKRTGNDRVYPVAITFDPKNKSYMVGDKVEGKTYSSLDSLIEQNSGFLSQNVKFMHYVPKNKIPGKDNFRVYNDYRGLHDTEDYTK